MHAQTHIYSVFSAHFRVDHQLLLKVQNQTKRHACGWTAELAPIPELSDCLNNCCCITGVISGCDYSSQQVKSREWANGCAPSIMNTLSHTHPCNSIFVRTFKRITYYPTLTIPTNPNPDSNLILTSILCFNTETVFWSSEDQPKPHWPHFPKMSLLC